MLPFYANIDTSGSGGGDIYYRLTSSNFFLQKIDKKIHELCGFDSNFISRTAIVATWDRVGYYNRKNDHVSY